MTKTTVRHCRQTIRALKQAKASMQAPPLLSLAAVMTLVMPLVMPLVMTTAGCGFHLRGQMPLSQPLQNVSVSSADQALQPIEDELIRALRQRGAQVNLSYARTRIELSQGEFSRYQISTNTDASAASYEYRYQIHYRFTDLFTPDRPALVSSVQSRMTQLALDNNTIGQEHAEAELKQRMEQDLAQRLLQRLTQISQSWDSPLDAEPSTKAQPSTPASPNNQAPSSTQHSSKTYAP